MDLELTSAPATALVSTAEVKSHLRIDHALEDTQLDALAAAALNLIEGRSGYLRRALVTQTWKWRVCEFPIERRIYLPFPPLQSLTSIKYYDADNVEQTFSSSNYGVNPRAFRGFVELNRSASWPGTYERFDAVTLEFVAGYGAAAAVPQAIKQAALLLIGDMYANRGDRDEMGGVEASEYCLTDSPAVLALLNPFRVF